MLLDIILQSEKKVEKMKVVLLFGLSPMVHISRPFARSLNFNPLCKVHS